MAQYAREDDFVILTNDRGFLDESRHPDVRVLCHTDNRASAYEPSAMVSELTIPEQDDLPRTTFLP